MKDINYLLNNVRELTKSVCERTFKGEVKYPVDLNRIAEEFNLPIYYEKLDDNLAGCFIAEDKGAAIVLNNNDAVVRQRFTLAHELGHFISYKIQEKTGKIFDERSTLAGLGTDPEEIFANKFAAELLMPKDEFMNKFKEFKNNHHDLECLDYLAKHFNVSRQAIEIRYDNLI